MNNRPTELLRYIEAIEQCVGKTAEKRMLPMQAGDVPETFADADDLVRDVGFRPATPVEAGVEPFVRWHRDFYRA